ncbi:hypothetical protein [Microvirga sp. KLBC 81]|uniref:hypothetical protein n=1 Tax=Microvirga sp. KLBC 81 TaxID=1862707 RepID=UPI00105837DE|nr:hypothetical protein [Microvirga sp. KLBC 81]
MKLISTTLFSVAPKLANNLTTLAQVLRVCSSMVDPSVFFLDASMGASQIAFVIVAELARNIDRSTMAMTCPAQGAVQHVGRVSFAPS